MQSLFFVAYLVAAVIGLLAVVRLARQPASPAGRLARRAMPAWGLVLVVLAVTAFEMASFRLSSPPEAFWDFSRAYYPAGRAALYQEPEALKALIRIGAAGGFVNIPVVAYLFAPFGWLPPHLAAMLFTLIGVGSTVVAWLLLVRLARLDLRARWLLALLFCANGPLLSGIKWGNISYFLVFLLAAGLSLLHAKRSMAAGMVLAAAAVLKPALALFGLFFLLRRDWHGLLGFVLVGVATVAASLLLFGWADNLYWLQTSILQYSDNWLAVSGNQSIPAFLFRLHESPGILRDFSVKVPGKDDKLLAHLITGLIVVLSAAACFGPRARAAAHDDAQASERRDLHYLLTICLCLVCSPLSWAHYYAWLLIPTAFFLRTQPSPLTASKPARIAGWTAIALVTPLVLWPQSSTHSILATAYASLAVSHHLFGGLLWFGLIAWWLARTGGVLSPANAINTGRAAASAG